MEYLQYLRTGESRIRNTPVSFKPYYKWNTFNTDTQSDSPFNFYSFKPYYKWNTFNTIVDVMSW